MKTVCTNIKNSKLRSDATVARDEKGQLYRLREVSDSTSVEGRRTSCYDMSPAELINAKGWEYVEPAEV